jgi:hypothetical protein
VKEGKDLSYCLLQLKNKHTGIQPMAIYQAINDIVIYTTQQILAAMPPQCFLEYY